MRTPKLNIPLSPKAWWGAWRQDYEGFSWWRRGLLRLATIGLVAGILLRTLFGGWDETFDSLRAAPASEVPRTALVDPDRPAAADGEEPSELWTGVSGVLMKCGLSFMLAFVAGYLLRKAIKLGVTLLLLVVGGLLLLNGLGWIDLPLAAWGEDLKALAVSLEGRSREFMELVKSWLPASASSGVGLFAGFRRS